MKSPFIKASVERRNLNEKQQTLKQYYDSVDWFQKRASMCEIERRIFDLQQNITRPLSRTMPHLMKFFLSIDLQFELGMAVTNKQLWFNLNRNLIENLT